ncbi:hypothetical protein [Virgibacillus salexigens]|uniref:Uncharacterized protein n=1 Tax=Virgibacillus massiliensis TaxID=1462526 RepID=A0A024QAK8_9BACI|nr:hypothetical protein [Virgibacillus massiliensis]CDQ39504.1 hypothetical protein BN990_01809 [Virgibacillus massiliensis]
MVEEKYTPSEYFTMVKDRKEKADDKMIARIYDNSLELLNKYQQTGQHKGARKLIFHLETLEKEKQVIDMGIDTFIYEDEITNYIRNVADDVVKIIELRNYEREVPDDIALAVEQVKDIFDEFYVVFTDYTGEVERQVEKERIDKDPILFGVFQKEELGVVIDRFYYIGDWEDEYCTLTLDKMVNQIKSKEKRNVEMKIKTPEDIQELKSQLNSLSASGENFRMNNDKKKSFFRKVRSFLGKPIK